MPFALCSFFIKAIGRRFTGQRLKPCITISLHNADLLRPGIELKTLELRI